MSVTQTPTATIGANVRAELARTQKPQTDLARHLGITQPGVSKRLRGVTPFDVDELVSVATWLDVPLATLLAGVEQGSEAVA